MITLERVQQEVEAVRKHALKLLGEGRPEEVCTDAKLCDEWVATYTVGLGDEMGFEVQVNLMTGEERQKGNKEKEWSSWEKITDWEKPSDEIYEDMFQNMEVGYVIARAFEKIEEEHQVLVLTILLERFCEQRNAHPAVVLARMLTMVSERS